MTATQTANRVREAEAIVWELLATTPLLGTTSLIQAIAEKVEDQSIASLALWELLDRGEVEFASRSRQEIRKAG